MSAGPPYASLVGGIEPVPGAPQGAVNPGIGAGMPDPGTAGLAATPPSELPPNLTQLEALLQAESHHIWSDHTRYYSWATLRDLALITGGAAIMAETRIDTDFMQWAQDHARSSSTNSEAHFWKNFGDGKIALPVFGGMAIIGKVLEDRSPILGDFGDYGDRVSRAYLVGSPPLLLMQELLGSGRPDVSGATSKWSPFSAPNGASGHAFIGAVPFITAANMSDNLFAKGALYFASVLPGWSRINDNQHYLSQVWMGWWMAYLACRAVDGTQQANQQISITPVMNQDMTGIGVMYQH
jgi:hypothetical protein